jgi:hypothetical protein
VKLREDRAVAEQPELLPRMRRSGPMKISGVRLEVLAGIHFIKGSQSSNSSLP